MIKQIFTISAFILSGIMMAQTEEQKVITTTTTTTTTTTVTEEPISSIRKNDVMLDPFALLSGIASISYERHLNKDMGVGISAFFVGKEYFPAGDNRTWYVLPYFRHYMGKKWARGFFIEGFTGIVNKEYEYYIPYSGIDPGFCGGECPPMVKTGKETNFGIGFGIGGKWETKRNIVFEVSGGLGRAFTAKKATTMFGKGMLGIGYRF